MPATAERAVILYGGDQPTADEVGRIVNEFERDTGIDLSGVRITSFGSGAGEPEESIVQFLLLQLEREGEVSSGALERMIVRTITVNGARRVVAVVLAQDSANAPARAEAASSAPSPGPAAQSPPAQEDSEEPGAAKGASVTDFSLVLLPRRTRHRGRAVVTVAAVTLLVLFVGLVAIHSSDAASQGTPTGSATAQDSLPADPEPSFSPDPVSSSADAGSSLPPGPNSSPPAPADPLADAAPGDCYANSGTEDSPQWLADSSCETGDFEVVQVESGATSSCSSVKGWDLSWPDPATNQVLCLAYEDSSPAYAASVNQCVFGLPGQQWDFASCDPGNFTVVGVYYNTTDRSHCGSNSDETSQYTVSGFPKLDKLFCLEMIFPYVATVQINSCLVQSGSGSDTSFSPASSCSEANVVVVRGRVFTPNDGSFCGQYGWYTWQSGDYPDLGVTVCLGPP